MLLYGLHAAHTLFCLVKQIRYSALALFCLTTHVIRSLGDQAKQRICNNLARCQNPFASRNDGRKDFTPHAAHTLFCLANSSVPPGAQNHLRCFAWPRTWSEVWVIRQNNVSATNLWYFEQQISFWLNFYLDTIRMIKGMFKKKNLGKLFDWGEMRTILVLCGFKI